MESIISSLLFLFFCFVVPAGVIVAIVKHFNRGKETHRERDQDTMLETFAFQVQKWTAQGRLPREMAAEVLALIRQDQAGAPEPARAAPPAPPPPLRASPSAGEAAAPPVPPIVVAAAQGPAATAALPAQPLGPSLGERLWSGMLALRTRWALLFLGAFLLVVSALILVVFNWNDFPAIVRSALLATVAAGLWGGGAWMARQSGLKQAGLNLQAVGGLLVPVAAYSLAHPDIFNLAPRNAWLLASVLSLPIYILAAWRTRQLLFAITGCLAAASALLAGLRMLDDQWLPIALTLLLSTYLPLAQWLRRRAPDLAHGPFWVAQVGVPLTLFAALLLRSVAWMDASAFATLLWASAAFYLLAVGTERRVAYAWVAASLLPLALLTTLFALDVDPRWWGTATALLALFYAAASAGIETRAREYAAPGYAIALPLAFYALLPGFGDAAVARWTLPLLLALAVMTTLLAQRGRFTLLDETSRPLIAAIGLNAAAVLLPAWLLALLDLTVWSMGQQGLLFLVLAALYFAAAFWWPGRLRQSYDLSLQILGSFLAFAAGLAILTDRDTWLLGSALLTAVWTFQTLLRRQWFGATATLGSALLLAFFTLDRLGWADRIDNLMWLALACTIVYAIAGTLLHRTAWRYWTWPAIGWALLTGLLTLLLGALDIDEANRVLVRHVIVVGALAALMAGMSVRWRRTWLGYPTAVLLIEAGLLAATRGFFTSWQPVLADYGLVICGLTLGLALLGQLVRRIEARYAYPYELLGFALLTIAPLPAINDVRAACLTWTAMALLYAFAAWRYRLTWASAPALIAVDMALLNGASWLIPSGNPAGAGQILLVAAWAQGLLGLWAHRKGVGANPGVRPTADDAQSSIVYRPSSIINRHGLALPVYTVTLLTSLGALGLASGDSWILMRVAFGLAALAALLATVERREILAWSALGLLALGLGSLHHALAIDLAWSLAWGVAEALALCLLAWVIALITQRAAATRAAYQPWHYPLTFGPLAAALALSGMLVLVAPATTDLPPLTFALATLGLLLATLAVRERDERYVYGAGAALVGAGLCQLADWGFTEPQWYVVPAGLYLLVLAEGLRRFQGRPDVSQVLEAGTALLMLGTTFGQSLRADGLTSTLYALLLCAEALLFLSYGSLRKLRVPFFGGMGFFVAGVVWLAIDPIRAANQWVLMGLLGLLLVGAYVLLERRQEQLVRAGRAFVEQLSTWR